MVIDMYFFPWDWRFDSPPPNCWTQSANIDWSWLDQEVGSTTKQLPSVKVSPIGTNPFSTSWASLPFFIRVEVESNDYNFDSDKNYFKLWPLRAGRKPLICLVVIEGAKLFVFKSSSLAIIVSELLTLTNKNLNNKWNALKNDLDH